MHNENGLKKISGRNIVGYGDRLSSVTKGVGNGTTSGTNLSTYCAYVTLTNYDLSGTETVDGASPSNGDRILVANQTDASENGIYIYDSSGAWTRSNGLVSGLQISVLGGTKQGTEWIVETASFAIGTDDISIIQEGLSRKAGDFGTFPTATITTSDKILFEDDSDDDEKKVASISEILSLVAEGSEIDNVYRTIYVSSGFTTGGAYYDSLSGAITYANTLAYNITIIVFTGTYTGNYSIDPNVILYFMPETVGVASDKTVPFLTFSAGARVYGYLSVDYAITSGYGIILKKNCVFEALYCLLDTDAIVINDSTGSALDVEIKINQLGRVNVQALVGNLYIESDKFSELTYAGTYDCQINCKLFKKDVTISSGKVILNTDRYFKADDTIFILNGGTLVANGRVDGYSDGTNSTTGDGHIAKIGAGTLKLHDFQAKNGGGGVIWGAGAGTLVIGNSILEATTGGGGGSSDSICGLVGFTVKYSGSTGMNNATAGGITEQITANKVQNANVVI